ncbi:MAG: DUF309 domain-containing protein [Candidatus Binataceae bacterium]
MHAELKQAIAVFNRGQYFEASELFEHTCASVGPELKEMVAALNRVAAAMHLRFHRGGRQSAINLLSQAMLTLEDFKPARGGIDVERLFRELSAFTDDLRKSPRGESQGVRHRARLFLERRRAPRIHRRG